jgi:hypothetical protein
MAFRWNANQTPDGLESAVTARRVLNHRESIVTMNFSRFQGVLRVALDNTPKRSARAIQGRQALPQRVHPSMKSRAAFSAKIRGESMAIGRICSRHGNAKNSRAQK